MIEHFQKQREMLELAERAQDEEIRKLLISSAALASISLDALDDESEDDEDESFDGDFD